MLQANTFSTFWINFKPKHTGTFQSTLNVELLNGIFQIPIKLSGSSKVFANKSSIQRGPEFLPEDFQTYRQSQLDKLTQIQSKHKYLSLDLKRSEKELESSEYLRLQRIERLQKEKQKKVQLKFSQLNQRLKELGFQNTNSD